MSTVIVIGGGLSGLSAAHTCLENGANVLVLDKNTFMGGNSTKATSGINAAGSRTQVKNGVKDTVEAFYEDTAKGARELARPELISVLVNESAPAVHWLMDSFDLNLTLLGRLGGHSFPRTHRGPERFPGMTITYALMERIEEISQDEPERCTLLMKAKATRLLVEDGVVVGVEYEHKGETQQARGPVIIATGGYGADFSPQSLLNEHRPDLVSANLATTNGKHCTGDGIRLTEQAGGNLCDMKQVQVHPTGLVDPKEPDSKVKFLAAGALRGAGGLILNGDGRRFCDELGHRDYVTAQMNANKGPFWLVLNKAASSEIEWHCKHYTGRGLMQHFQSGQDLAKAMGVSSSRLADTFDAYNVNCSEEKDQFGKKFFPNFPLDVKDSFYAGNVTPVVHYTMGGIEIDGNSQVKSNDGLLEGLFAAGEAAGGIHGENRLGGSSLLDCVVFGRVAGRSASKYLMQQLLSGKGGVSNNNNNNNNTNTGVSINVVPGSNKVSVEVTWNGEGSSVSTTSTSTSDNAKAEQVEEEVQEETGRDVNKIWSLEEVAKHNTEQDCWCVVNGQVLDVTSFLADHPGGKKAILLFAGRDASAEFNMLHKRDVVDKYAPECIIGVIAKASL